MKIRATYEDGVLKPQTPLPLPEHAEVEVEVEAGVRIGLGREAIAKRRAELVRLRELFAHPRRGRAVSLSEMLAWIREDRAQ